MSLKKVYVPCHKKSSEMPWFKASSNPDSVCVVTENACKANRLIEELINLEKQTSYAYETEFRSLHESESVIREEIEEVSEALEKLKSAFDVLHVAMRQDSADAYIQALYYIKTHSIDLLTESIQVVAMASKSEDSFCEK